MGDVDDMFNQLTEHLDVDMAGVGDVVNVCLLDDATLISRSERVRQELLDLGEMVTPTTTHGRELHSQRVAYMVELRRRRLG